MHTNRRNNTFSYRDESVLHAVLSRIPWLLILMFSATFTGVIISAYESALSASVYLTAFIPMLMGTGGNAGSQASVTVIRALSHGEIERQDAGRTLKKEFRIALICALLLGIATFLKVCLIDSVLIGAIPPPEIFRVALTVSLTLTLTVLFAKLIGALLPLFAHHLGFDPAVMASPFITTAVDAVSLILYFQVARLFIPGL